MEMGEAQAAAREELERRLAAQLEGLFAADAGDEGALARCFVAALGPGDAQEQALAVQMALSHQFAVARIGAARRPELPERPQQIELGLAARFMTLHHRESAAFDRHRDAKARAAERVEKRAAQQAAQQAARRPWRTPGRVTQRMTEAAPPGTFPPAPGASMGAFEAASPAAFEPEQQPRASFIVVPEPVSPEQWDREAKAHHARMATGEMPSDAERAVWNARCERAMAEARARGQNGGILRVPYPSLEEMAREVAEWEAAETGGEATATEFREAQAAHRTAAVSGAGPPAARPRPPP
jgi:hypothetical protein